MQPDGSSSGGIAPKRSVEPRDEGGAGSRDTGVNDDGKNEMGKNQPRSKL